VPPRPRERRAARAARRADRRAHLGRRDPETADYRVVADPDDTVVGTVNEDWAIESMAGDVFLLGSTSWQIRRVETASCACATRTARRRPCRSGSARRLRAAPSSRARCRRCATTSRASSRRRRGGDARRARGARGARTRRGAAQVVAYLDASHTRSARCRAAADRGRAFLRRERRHAARRHAPFGGRINRALGLVARKRICRAFDFELQAAASDDAFVLSLGPQHSFRSR
jgi:ATP-dependent Lhr-like helicase